MPLDPISLGGREYAVRLPPSFTVRHEVTAAGASNLQRAAAAALGLCCPTLQLRARYAYQPLVYGGQVLDELVGRGLTAGDVLGVAGVVFSQLAATVLVEEEIEAAGGNSEAPAGA